MSYIAVVTQRELREYILCLYQESRQEGYLMKQEYKILLKTALFREINADDIESIIGCLGGYVKSYTKNQLLIQADESELYKEGSITEGLVSQKFPGEAKTFEISSLGIVLSGSVQVMKEDIVGNRMIINLIREGEIFGETFACAGIRNTSVSVSACENSIILWMPVNRIITPCSDACNFHSRLIGNLLEILAKKNLYLNQKMELLSKRNIRDKIMYFLMLQMEEKRSPSFEIPFNRNEMADYLCIDRSAMSRELGKLQAEGLIDFHKNSFRIKMPVKSAD